MLLHDDHLERDLRLLAKFLDIYCADKHAGVEKHVATLKMHDVEAVAGRSLSLCPSCHALLAHAFTKRTNCPLEPKPACKRCSEHCYHPKYRERIREVMKYSGRTALLRGRLDYFFHLLF